MKVLHILDHSLPIRIRGGRYARLARRVIQELSHQ